MSDETPILSPDGDVLFSHDELACRLTGKVLLHPGFADALRELRLSFDRPMNVTSCCRSADHNKNVKGHPRSLHVFGLPATNGAEGTLAIDIARQDGSYAWQLLFEAQRQGWSVGVARTFIHLDRRDLVGLAPAAFGYGQ